VHVLLQPAAFARDCSFRTWKSFRETRAVETGCYFLGVNYAGENFGESSLNPPWIDEDHEPTVLGTEASYIVATLNPTILQEARTDFPFFRHTVNPSACRGRGARVSDDLQGN
jgi:predicted amidohydrolase